MYTINDSMLTLILRFAGRQQSIALSDQEFIRKQLSAIQEHLENYPPEEQETQALEWIAMHADNYRKTWEQENIAKEVSSHRCRDCPLSEAGNFGHCLIHEQWLALLKQYAANEINSRQYIESSLEMLTQNKEYLRIKQGMLTTRGA